MFLILYSVFLVILEEQQSHEFSQVFFFFFFSQVAYSDLSASHMGKKPPPPECLPPRASVDRKHNLSPGCELPAKPSKCDLKWHSYKKTPGQNKEGRSPRVHSAGVGSHLKSGVGFCVLKMT